MLIKKKLLLVTGLKAYNNYDYAHSMSVERVPLPPTILTLHRTTSLKANKTVSGNSVNRRQRFYGLYSLIVRTASV